MIWEELFPYIKAVLDKELNDIRTDNLTISINSERTIVNYPNSDVLINLYSQATNEPKVQEIFISFLCSKIFNLTISTAAPISSYNEKLTPEESLSGLCFYTLILLGFSDKAIEVYEKRESNFLRLNIILYHLLLANKSCFDFNQLDKITMKIKNTNFTQREQGVTIKLLTLLIENRFNIVKNKTNKVNVEINQDKRIVIEKIKYLGFDESYHGFLDEIDKFLLDDRSETINSGMISNLRSFLESLFKVLAYKIANKYSEILPKDGETEMANVRTYLKNKLELTDKENKFLTKFIEILHKEGGHSFVSTKEYFRLSRNIAIEIAYFILSKSEKILSLGSNK